MRSGVYAVLVGVFAACREDVCHLPCRGDTLDPFVYCMQDQNCSVGGVAITSCKVGGGNVCPLWTLQPGQVLAIPFDRIWLDAGASSSDGGSLRDLEIMHGDESGPDLTKATVLFDDVEASCERSARTIVCKGVGPALRVLKFKHAGPGSVGRLYLAVLDVACRDLGRKSCPGWL
jgi:hypothetical protein